MRFSDLTVFFGIFLVSMLFVPPSMPFMDPVPEAEAAPMDSPADAITDLSLQSISKYNNRSDRNSITLSWSEPNDNGSPILFYNVQVYGSTSNSWQVLENDVYGTTYTHNNAPVNIQMTYRVYAIAVDGCNGNTSTYYNACNESNILSVVSLPDGESGTPASQCDNSWLDDCGYFTDETAPVVLVPGDITIFDWDGGGEYVDFSAYGGVNATDNEGVTSGPSCTTMLAQIFTNTETVTCTATDAAGNVGTASFTVTIIPDTTPPTITLQDSTPITRVATNSTGWNVGYTVISQDNSYNGNNSPAASCSPASNSLFPVGTTTVTCTVADAAGNVQTLSFTVIVALETSADTFPPEIRTPAEMRDFIFDGSGSKIVTFTSGVILDPCPSMACSSVNVSAYDNVGVTSGPTCTPESGYNFPLGTTTVTCTATDAAGNVGTASFPVIIDQYNNPDPNPPVVTPPSNIIVQTTNQQGTIVTFSNGTATDNVGITGGPNCEPISGSMFPIGVTTVTCVAYDTSSNVGTASFTVTVNLEGASESSAPPVTYTTAEQECLSSAGLSTNAKLYTVVTCENPFNVTVNMGQRLHIQNPNGGSGNMLPAATYNGEPGTYQYSQGAVSGTITLLQGASQNQPHATTNLLATMWGSNSQPGNKVDFTMGVKNNNSFSVKDLYVYWQLTNYGDYVTSWQHFGGSGGAAYSGTLSPDMTSIYYSDDNCCASSDWNDATPYIVQAFHYDGTQLVKPNVYPASSGSSDTTPPVVTVPSNLTFQVDSEATGDRFLTSSNVGFDPSGAITATDNVAVEYNTAFCDSARFQHLPGYMVFTSEAGYWNMGTSTVTCYAEDAAGNVGTASFTVTLTSEPDPCVNCSLTMNSPYISESLDNYGQTVPEVKYNPIGDFNFDYFGDYSSCLTVQVLKPDGTQASITYDTACVLHHEKHYNFAGYINDAFNASGWTMKICAPEYNMCVEQNFTINFAFLNVDTTPTVTVSAYLNATSSTGRTLAITGANLDDNQATEVAIHKDGVVMISFAQFDYMDNCWSGQFSCLLIPHMPPPNQTQISWQTPLPEHWDAGTYGTHWRDFGSNPAAEGTASFNVPALSATEEEPEQPTTLSVIAYLNATSPTGR
ncbi:HYR domain-containing protein, partial [Marine Group I thaumarchaeote]|nr:HYR domain-containing protein [Marine Group I thaumarchaeote]